MRIVVVLALAGFVALVVAVLTGSTPLAFAVIALAVAGIGMLLRDWRAERAATVAAAAADVLAKGDAPVSPDEFSPDISTDPNGPSSDARAD